MVNAVDNLRGLVLSAIEIKSLTGWPDAMVEDYLNILDNLISLAEAIDENDTDNVDISNSILSSALLPLKYQPTSDTVSADYSTAGDQILLCSNSDRVTVTLSDTPDDFEFVKVKRTNGEIVIDGNGKQIDGADTVTIKRRIHLTASCLLCRN